MAKVEEVGALMACCRRTAEMQRQKGELAMKMKES